jgi:hypothetical protein
VLGRQRTDTIIERAIDLERVVGVRGIVQLLRRT